jgi:hypothetical protein
MFLSCSVAINKAWSVRLVAMGRILINLILLEVEQFLKGLLGFLVWRAFTLLYLLQRTQPSVIFANNLFKRSWQPKEIF